VWRAARRPLGARADAAAIPLTGAIARAPGAAAEAMLLGLAFLAGALTGGPFPWVSALIARREGGVAAGGIADAADNAGALFGALATGTLLVPLLGFAGALVTLAAIKLVSAAGWLGRAPVA